MTRRKPITIRMRFIFLAEHFGEFADFRHIRELGCFQTWNDAKRDWTGNFPTLEAAVDYRIREQRERKGVPETCENSGSTQP